MEGINSEELGLDGVILCHSIAWHVNRSWLLHFRSIDIYSLTDLLNEYSTMEFPL
jgi:hypothetical protein